MKYYLSTFQCYDPSKFWERPIKTNNHTKLVSFVINYRRFIISRQKPLLLIFK